MSSHHDHHDHHSEEAKPVAFRTPMILGLVTLLAIVLLVSTCDKKHGVAHGNGEGHAIHHQTEATEEHSDKGTVEKMEEHVPVITDTIAKADAAHVEEHAAH